MIFVINQAKLERSQKYVNKTRIRVALSYTTYLDMFQYSQIKTKSIIMNVESKTHFCFLLEVRKVGGGTHWIMNSVPLAVKGTCSLFTNCVINPYTELLLPHS